MLIIINGDSKKEVKHERVGIKGPFSTLMQRAPRPNFLPFKIVFLKSHPAHINNCFPVNTFAARHFTVSLQYFEFCPEESEENFF